MLTEMLEIQATQPQREAGTAQQAKASLLTRFGISPLGILQSLDLVSPQAGLGLHLDKLPVKSKWLWLWQKA